MNMPRVSLSLNLSFPFSIHRFSPLYFSDLDIRLLSCNFSLCALPDHLPRPQTGWNMLRLKY